MSARECVCVCVCVCACVCVCVCVVYSRVLLCARGFVRGGGGVHARPRDGCLCVKECVHVFFLSGVVVQGGSGMHVCPRERERERESVCVCVCVLKSV